MCGFILESFLPLKCKHRVLLGLFTVFPSLERVLWREWSDSLCRSFDLSWTFCSSASSCLSKSHSYACNLFSIMMIKYSKSTVFFSGRGHIMKTTDCYWCVYMSVHWKSDKNESTEQGRGGEWPSGEEHSCLLTDGGRRPVPKIRRTIRSGCRFRSSRFHVLT